MLRKIWLALASVWRRVKHRVRLPDYIYYINGPETLPPPLSREEEQAVFEGLEQGDEHCRDLLIVHNLRLVVYIAKKFETKGTSVEDLISKTEEEMMKVRNLGRKSLEEVINKLSTMGLSLASDDNV